MRRTLMAQAVGNIIFSSLMVISLLILTACTTLIPKDSIPGRGVRGDVMRVTITTPPDPPIEEVDPTPGLIAITAGDKYTCALSEGGDAYCWGMNWEGQLGHVPAKKWERLEEPTRTQVAGVTFRKIAAGGKHTCALTADGEAYCWGFNDTGQIGDTSTQERHTPVPVHAPYSGWTSSHDFMKRGELGFTAITAGTYFTCAIAQTEDAYCWGQGVYGQLGNSTPKVTWAPLRVLVAGAPVGAPGVRFRAIAAGGFHTCGISREGKAYCWGAGHAGQLGRKPGKLLPELAFTAGSVWGQQGLVFRTITSGHEHTCAVASGGRAYCWGNNIGGQLGDGTTEDRSEPTLVQAPEGVRFRVIEAGAFHTCALSVTGVAYCWGNNIDGKIGDGTISLNRTKPTPVDAPAGVTFKAITAGSDHTCALTEAGGAYCWGSNSYGQLSYPPNNQRRRPSPVVGGW